MAREVTSVDVSGPAGPVWGAMVFLAVLGYPEDVAKRERAILAMRAWGIRGAREFGYPLGERASEFLSAMAPQQERNTLRRLNERMVKRLKAAEVAAYLLMGLRRRGKLRPIPPAEQQRTRQALMQRGLSFERANEMTMKVSQEPGRLYTLNDFAKRSAYGASRFKSEVWKPEVLHLATALHAVRLQWRDPRGFNVLRLLANPEWSLRALRQAEEEAEHLPRAINLPAALRGFREDRLIRLVPVGLEISVPAPPA